MRRWILIEGAIVALLLSCGVEKKPPPPPLSPDEAYLVHAYLRVRRAGALFTDQRAAGDSVLTVLAGEVDTLRIARTVAGLNATPERWAFVLESIEHELTKPNTSAPSESTGR